MDGLSKAYYENGKLAEEMKFKEGRFIYGHTYSEDNSEKDLTEKPQ